jgi:succinate dehydrogenase/fumarate reductase cytochrome b subunit
MTIRRPGVVTFIGVIVTIQGFLALVAGVAVILFRDDGDIQQATNQSSSALLGAGIGELIVAALLLAIGFGILNGSRVSRFVVALGQGISMALATWLLLTHHTGGYTSRSLITLLIGVFVIWALYGNDESEAYFEAT